MRIYFSGVDRASYLHLLASENADAMISPPRCLLLPSVVEAMSTISINTVADSGAFQGEADVNRYANLIQKAASHYSLDWYANLDVIGDQQASHQNYRKLVEMLPSELSRKVLWVFQGDDFSLLKEMAQQAKYVGIGGLVPIASDFNRLKFKLDSCGQILNEVGAKAHLFGINGVRALKWVTLQDWFYSADSTAWLYGLKATEIFTTNGDRVRMSKLGLLLTKEERARNNIRVIQSFLSAPSNQLSFFDEEIAS